jgi:hypothetical protein
VNDEKDDDLARVESEVRAILEEASSPLPRDGNIENHGAGNNVVAINSTVIIKGAVAAARKPKTERRKLNEVLLEAIRERAAALVITEDQILEVATNEVRERLVVSSLNALNERELGRVYEALAKLRRPALGETK